MIKGFEKETASLSADEITVAGYTVTILKNQARKGTPVSSKMLIKHFKKHGYTLQGVRIRKIINYIRRNALVPGVVAASKGYYVAESAADLREYTDSLAQRIDSITEIQQVMLKDLKTFELIELIEATV